ncbi:MAG: threonylcarbamoyl-AMP synthase [Nitrosopumilus sp.]|nr:threonylcarbamoyl-AMP synthase [Nitrosopumilus sp.]NNL53041.1 threonylcarbamoyl-AMP synthase [Nitrosopumilus sp.]
MKGLRVACDTRGISQVVKVIKNGGIAVFPTDTVYGVGADPFNKKAVDTIYKIKKRNRTKPLPILGYSKEEISKIAGFDSLSDKIADHFWPGSITLILKLKNQELKKSLGLNHKVAVRVPNNECTLSVLKECKLIVGTSANVSGEKALISPDDHDLNLTGIDIILDGGKIVESKESTILEVREGRIKILRKGKVSLEEIEKLL